MNRLQKKCVIGTAGVHLLLLLILFAGPAFFSRRSKVNDVAVLDVIPASLVDGLLSSGEPDAAPPPPAPVAPPQPAPPAPVVVTPPTPPAPPAPPVKVEKTEPDPTPDKLSPDSLKPVVKPAKTEPHKISTTLVTHKVPKNSPNTSTADSLQAQQAQQDRQARAIGSALRSLKNNLTTGTKVGIPGTGTASYASYGTVIVSIYRHAWVPPDGMASDNAVVRFSVTIASDGTVISARITEPSGDANIDSAVQRMLDRVSFIAPFPEGVTERQRSYPINFNATRRSIE
jgi:TonB family protein